MRLIASRATGKVADADGVMDKFNQAASEPVDAEMFASEAVQDSVAGDGALPGGMDPAMIRMLSSDPEIMGFLKEPKFQAIMKVQQTLFDKIPSGCFFMFHICICYYMLYVFFPEYNSNVSFLLSSPTPTSYRNSLQPSNPTPSIKAVMTGGPDALMSYLGDPQAVKMLQAISVAVARVQSKPPNDDDNVLQ